MKRKKNEPIVSRQIDTEPLEELLTKEWLLTNNRGGYASSTIIGCNTRKYHGLLIGSLNPPVNRIMALSQCLEMLVTNSDVTDSDESENAREEKIYNLTPFEFEGKLSVQGLKYLKSFRRDKGVNFEYRLPGVKLNKSVYLLQDSNVVVVVYDFAEIAENLEFVLRPFIGLRDFHTLQKSYAPLYARRIPYGLSVRHEIPGSCELIMNAPEMRYEEDKKWWFDFLYRNEKERGYEYTEDLWTPGFYKCYIDSPRTLSFWAGLYGPEDSSKDKFTSENDIKKACDALAEHQSSVMNLLDSKDKKLRMLSLAADQFIVKRGTDHNTRTTILAGFPWFADWGRDAFLSLPGLLLENGRYQEARSILSSFASAVDEGIIPNRFDDYSNTAYFNSVDASLWFINACFQYLDKTGDFSSFSQALLPAIRWIVHSYKKGTKFGIRADEDGLIIAGGQNTQLTWMDAKCEGIPFTPRFGKAVEVNALWYNSLRWLMRFYAPRNGKTKEYYNSLADNVQNSFLKVFWNESIGYLNDCVLPEGTVDSTLRPNQIFAVSLPFSPLTASQKKAVVGIIEQKLLTPFGLRTLETSHERYRGRYTGTPKERDRAYHQGTVWPYLIGAFVESYLKVNNFNRKSKRKALRFIKPLMKRFTQDNCLGNIAEICDGDAPYHPRGCIAQAWNIAELIRAYRLIKS